MKQSLVMPFLRTPSRVLCNSKCRTSKQREETNQSATRSSQPVHRGHLFPKGISRKGFAELRKEFRVVLMVDKTPREVGTNYLLLTHPFRLVVYVPTAISASPLRNGNLGQTDILHDSPDNGETTGFRGEGINLIGALPHIAKEAFNGIGRA